MESHLRTIKKKPLKAMHKLKVKFI